jgi:hypothetical protein
MCGNRGTRAKEIAMLPHPSMSFAWEEDVVRPTRVLVAIFMLVLIVAVGASVLIEFTVHDSPATVAAQRETQSPRYTTGR